MSNAIKTERLNNGYSVHIAPDIDSGVDILDWEWAVGMNIWQRRYRDVHMRPEFGTDVPDYGDWDELLEAVAYHYGKNARGEDVAEVMGLGWLVMYDMLFSNRPEFRAGSDEYALEPWQSRLLSRGVAYVRKRFHYLPVRVYDHSGVSYSAGYGHDRWDGGYVGYIVGEVEKFKAFADFERACDDFLQDYTDWVNGDVYEVVVVNAYGDGVEYCGGYIGWESAEEGLQELVEQYKEATDDSVFMLGTVEDRCVAYSALVETLGEEVVAKQLAEFGITATTTTMGVALMQSRGIVACEDQAENVLWCLGDVDHHKICSVRMVNPDLAGLVGVYQQAYRASVLESLAE